MIKKKKGKETKQLEYGDKISFLGIYESPDEQRNTGGFDSTNYFKSKKLYGKVTAEGDITILQKRQVSLFSFFIYHVQVATKDKIKKLLPGEEGNLLLGLLLGNTSFLSEDTIESFKDSNLSHLLAVSGAHVSYVILGVTSVLKKSKVGKKGSILFACAILFLFMAVTGFTCSVTRAGIMGILMLVSPLCRRKSDVFTNLSFSFLFLLITNPFCIYDLGLQFSFSGTIRNFTFF